MNRKPSASSMTICLSLLQSSQACLQTLKFITLTLHALHSSTLMAMLLTFSAEGKVHESDCHLHEVPICIYDFYVIQV